MLVLAFVTLLQAPPYAPRPLTLDEAISRGLARRGQVAVAASAVAVARAGVRLAGQVPNPTGSYSQTDDPPRRHLMFDQSLAWLATRGADRATARAGLQRARADSMVLIAGVAQEVRLTFFRALAAEQGLRLVEAQLQLADSVARLARRRFEAGDISQLELEQVSQDARRQQLALSSARESHRVAIAALAQAVAWTDAAPPSPSGALDLELDAVIEPVPASLPLIEAAVADSIAGWSAVRSAQRARIPMPSLQAGAEWNDPDKPGQTLSVVALAIPLPVWHQNGGEIAAARALAERASAEVVETRLSVGRALAEAKGRLEESASRARFARDSLVPAARALRERAVLAYQSGETGLLPVLDALRSEREITLNALEQLAAYQEALANWRALLGSPPLR